MQNHLLYIPSGSAAVKYAGTFLKRSGLPIIDHPAPEITHLLLDVPSFFPDGSLRCGKNPEKLLESLPEKLTIIGGNLDHPVFSGYRFIDLLKDETYLAENACITAYCALRMASGHLQCTYRNLPVLVIGWGRIGKCLAQLLKGLGAQVTVSARKESDLAMLSALGYTPLPTDKITSHYRLILNTVPAPVLTEAEETDSVLIDLASVPGILSSKAVTARGLPGKLAPESSGRLIADTVLHIFNKEEVL